MSLLFWSAAVSKTSRSSFAEQTRWNQPKTTEHFDVLRLMPPRPHTAALRFRGARRAIRLIPLDGSPQGALGGLRDNRLMKTELIFAAAGLVAGILAWPSQAAATRHTLINLS